MNPNALPRGVCVIPFRDGRFCMSQRVTEDDIMPRQWQFAGGRVELWESPIAAAFRELLEETAVAIHESARFIPLGSNKQRGYRDELYIRHAFGVILRPNEEPHHAEPHKATPWEWLLPCDLKRLPMLPNTVGYARQLGVRLGMDGSDFDN